MYIPTTVFVDLGIFVAVLFFIDIAKLIHKFLKSPVPALVIGAISYIIWGLAPLMDIMRRTGKTFTEAFLQNSSYLSFEIIGFTLIALMIGRPLLKEIEPNLVKLSHLQQRILIERFRGQPLETDSTTQNTYNDILFRKYFNGKNMKPSYPRTNPLDDIINMKNNLKNDSEEDFMSSMASGKVKKQKLGKRMKKDPKAWESLIGMEEPLRELRLAIELPLQQPEIKKKYNYKSSKGMILTGPPGNGKTELARTVASGMGLYFIEANAASLLGTLVGSTEQNIKNLFEEARQNAPSIIFFDEIDAIGRKRGSTNTSHLDTALNQLLIELDGFQSNENVFVIAATNRIDVLDEALIRSGRFDAKIHIPNPDQETRTKMWQKWLIDATPCQEVFPIELAFETNGASGADIRGYANEIIRNAAEKAMQLKIQQRLGRIPTIYITREDCLRVIRKAKVRR